MYWSRCEHMMCVTKVKPNDRYFLLFPNTVTYIGRWWTQDVSNYYCMIVASFCFQTLLYAVAGVCDQNELEAQWLELTSVSVSRQENRDWQTTERWKQTWETAAPGKTGQYVWHTHSTNAGKIGLYGKCLYYSPLSGFFFFNEMENVHVDLS